MTPQPGTAGTGDDPLAQLVTQELTVNGQTVTRLVGLAFDSAEQTDGVLRFDGTGSTNGITDGSAKVLVNGTVHDVAGAEWVDLSGTRHTVDSWEKVINSQFDVSITGTTSSVAPGNTLDVTADVTNSGTDQDTQTVTLDINNGVGQVDSTSVTLTGGGSTTQTLSWAVPSGQTEQDYQATVASADDSASETVTVSAGTAIDDFESYATGSLPSEYTAVNNGGPSEVVSSRAFSGSQSLKAAGETAGGLSPRVERTFSAITPSELQMVYKEFSDNKGISVQWYGSNGDELCSVGSANPTPSVYNGSGTKFGVNPSPGYGEWRRITVTPDFASGTFDVLWEDLTGTTADFTASGFSFNGSPTDVARVTIGGDRRGPRMGPNDSNPAYIDDLGVFP